MEAELPDGSDIQGNLDGRTRFAKAKEEHIFHWWRVAELDGNCNRELCSPLFRANSSIRLAQWIMARLSLVVSLFLSVGDVNAIGFPPRGTLPAQQE
jgi:hypothetical protein